MSYDQLRHLADSWGLVMLTIMFLTLVGWTFRRGAAQRMDDAAQSIFKSDRIGDGNHGE
jgi:cytochrome c oxidase cbb3-type subunit 4